MRAIKQRRAIYEKLKKNRSRRPDAKTTIYLWHRCYSWPISSIMVIASYKDFRFVSGCHAELGTFRCR